MAGETASLQELTTWSWCATWNHKQLYIKSRKGCNVTNRLLKENSLRRDVWGLICATKKDQKKERERMCVFPIHMFITLRFGYLDSDLDLMVLIVYNGAQLEVSSSHRFYLRLWTEKPANSFISHIKTSQQMNNTFGGERILGLNQWDYKPGNINKCIKPAKIVSGIWYTF